MEKPLGSHGESSLIAKYLLPAFRFKGEFTLGFWMTYSVTYIRVLSIAEDGQREIVLVITLITCVITSGCKQTNMAIVVAEELKVRHIHFILK